MGTYNVIEKLNNAPPAVSTDGSKIVSISGYDANRLADLALHRENLAFGQECLKLIEEYGSRNEILRMALWRCAVVHYLRCFSNTAKFRLSPEVVYDDCPLKDYESYLFFKSLNNKYLFHDAESYKQNIPCAVINDGSKEFKIEEVTCVSLFGESLIQDNLDSLIRLTDIAKDWVDTEYEVLCACIALRLEKEPYEKLANREEIKSQLSTDG